MEGGAYGAGKAGGAFDPQTFIRQPHTILRMISWLFSIVVFGCIVNEGYVNNLEDSKEFCIFNRNQNACNYGVTVGVLAFLSSLLYLALDIHFPQISSVKDRKKAVLSDIAVSAVWSFLWFVGFCFLTNQWQRSKLEDNPLNEGVDAARAAITFSFFSIFTWSSNHSCHLGQFLRTTALVLKEPCSDGGKPQSSNTLTAQSVCLHEHRAGMEVSGVSGQFTE
uniref:Synaptogyrin n=1 Tax=Geotrypetes seraphini TaxID=260995 RepID=A0A6P8PTK3_GEOSA|nr:synaptogyrin-1 isoform X2 [Geotrypetes seraphini]